MSDWNDPPITQLLDQQHFDAALRRESLGPIAEAVGQLRACCETVRLLLDEVETTVGVHLELLDVALQTRRGSRWWDELNSDRHEREERS